jgi:nucleoid-associated protein YgaU
MGGIGMGILQRLGLRKTTVAPPSLGGKVIRVGPGETLRTIARREYGDEDAWERILAANRQKVTDAEALNVGDELRLP